MIERLRRVRDPVRPRPVRPRPVRPRPIDVGFVRDFASCNPPRFTANGELSACMPSKSRQTFAQDTVDMSGIRKQARPAEDLACCCRAVVGSDLRWNVRQVRL